MPGFEEYRPSLPTPAASDVPARGLYRPILGCLPATLIMSAVNVLDTDVSRRKQNLYAALG